MTKKKFPTKLIRQEHLANILKDVANIIMASVIIDAFTQKPPEIKISMLGFTIYSILITMSVALKKKL